VPLIRLDAADAVKEIAEVVDVVRVTCLPSANNVNERVT
jgi:hypothetical protein